jgi:cytoskeletal protein CcmA (bactofilin family)
MRRTLSSFLLAAALAAAGCGGTGTTPTAPSNGAGNADASSSPRPPAASGAETDFRGLVEAVPPSTPALTFRAAGRTVVTNAATRFGEGGSPRLFADLKVGDSVEVRGTASGDTVTASRVEIEDRAGDPGPSPGPGPNPGPSPGPNPDPNPRPNPGPQPEVDIRGIVTNLSGSATRFEFTLNGVRIAGDASTDLENDDDDDTDRDTPASFGDLANGVEVHVKGTQVAAGSILAREIEIEDEADDDDDDDDEARVRGRLGAITGTCPSITSTAAGVRFTTSSSTRFDDRCTSFGAGDNIEIRGRRNSDGSIAATRLRKR